MTLAGTRTDAGTPYDMRLAHVVPHVHEEASGPSYSVPRLCSALAAQGHALELHCLAGDAPPGVELHRYKEWPRPKRLAVSPALAHGVRAAAQRCDIVHNHSLWSMANIASGWVVPGQQAKLVVSPRGTVSAWALAHSKRVKRALWPLQRRAVARADLLHATSETELEEIRALNLHAPIAVVPNGIDLPGQRPPRAPDAPRTLLFLSRIHPKKGIDLLMQAWQRLQSRHPDWRLVIAGRGEPVHEQQVQALAEELRLQRVEFPGALYGKDKTDAYHAADMFVLPTHSENFGMVVAEALAHGLPSVVSRGAPWPALEREGSGWWIESGSIDALQQALDTAMRLAPEQRAAMGVNGREWMRRDFGWDAVAERMATSYRWLLSGGDRPGWIAIND